MYCIELRNLLLRVLSAAVAAVLVLRHLFAPSLWTISLNATVREREKCIQKKRRRNENGKGGIKQKNEWCSVKCGCSACVDIITKADNYINCFRPQAQRAIYTFHTLSHSLSHFPSLSLFLPLSFFMFMCNDWMRWMPFLFSDQHSCALNHELHSHKLFASVVPFFSPNISVFSLPFQASSSSYFALMLMFLLSCMQMMLFTINMHFSIKLPSHADFMCPNKLFNWENMLHFGDTTQKH